MSPSDAASDVTFKAEAAPAPLAKTRPFYWSVRRELWENRSIYMAPLIAAAVVLFGVLLGAINLPHLLHAHVAVKTSGGFGPTQQTAAVAASFAFPAYVIMFTAFVAGAFYCLGALYGERRDRSILFWKSLPVSDLITVLAKASVVLVVLPLITFVVIVVMQAIMLLVAWVTLPAGGLSPGLIWSAFPPAQAALTLLYLLACLSLWYAPIWGWLLMVSAWAKRVAFLWALGPPLALCVVEVLAFHSAHVWSLLKYRLAGGYIEAFAVPTPGQAPISLDRLDPLRFVSTPGLWVGLLAAAIFLAAAVWLRRRRDPI